MWILKTNLNQIFPNLDGIRCERSRHTVTEETGEVNKIFKEEFDCPESTSCVLVAFTFPHDYDYGESKKYRIKS